MFMYADDVVDPGGVWQQLQTRTLDPKNFKEKPHLQSEQRCPHFKHLTLGRDNTRNVSTSIERDVVTAGMWSTIPR